MRTVELPDEIAQVLLEIAPEQRGDFLRRHGFVLSVLKQNIETAGEKTYELFSDGAARGNPGPAGIGFLIRTGGEVIAQGKKYLGTATNNQSEWTALKLGLEKARELNILYLHCFLDSELVVKQMRGEYRVKHPDLLPLFTSVREIARTFARIDFTHVPREQNQAADTLSNEAIDELAMG